MGIQASGRVVRDESGLELIVERRVPLPAGETWDWLTASARLKKWIGPRRGRAVVGGTVDLTMTAEEGSPTSTLTLDACEPGERYTVAFGESADAWRITISLADLGTTTAVYLKQRLANARDAGSIGPGWEWYLDRMLAAIAGTEMPDFDEYLTVQRPYYERLAMDGDPVSWPPS
ncbi:uncharacterized protein YndB with AHSA1/START domain [Leifsonia sp. AK011]|uniref:SRPBCC domain-containing protein n=1 Tax=Leifsonia sp. AK011 TaxID=2723075 RepID=UPI0015CB50F8|nr:SRPBCC domain-containing protein [Leifsonia sp. AK011]NYF09181.1 uncharacterized protein YndB with AHSA1/START domain [Leifsonia sp. AK011]